MHARLIKHIYLKVLLISCFNRKKYGHMPTPLGHFVLRVLPHPSVTWSNGNIYKPNYFNRRWLLSSLHGSHEPALEDFIISVIKEGNTVIDVGAQVGLISVLLGRKVGSSGRVVAFEPNPYNYRILNETLKENLSTNVVSVNKAVGRTNAYSYFRQLTPTGYMKIPPEAKGEDSEATLIEVVCLDDYCRENNIDKVDFIKVDIDGPDFEAVLGAEGLLKSAYPPLLCVEVSQYWARHGYFFSDALSYLNSFNYNVCICHRKSSEVILVNDVSDIPEGWGMRPKLAYNLYAWVSEVHNDMISPFISGKSDV